MGTADGILNAYWQRIDSPDIFTTVSTAEVQLTVRACQMIQWHSKACVT